MKAIAVFLLMVMASMAQSAIANDADSNALEQNWKRYQAEAERQKTIAVTNAERELKRLRERKIIVEPMPSTSLPKRIRKNLLKDRATRMRNARKEKDDAIKVAEEKLKALQSEPFRPTLGSADGSVGWLKGGIIVVQILGPDSALVQTVDEVWVEGSGPGLKYQPQEVVSAVFCLSGASTANWADGKHVGNPFPVERVQPYTC